MKQMISIKDNKFKDTNNFKQNIEKFCPQN